MRMSHLAFTAALALALAAPRLVAQNSAPMRDTTAYTLVATGLRAQPQLAATILTNLPAGWPVHVSGCLIGWCSAQAGPLAGYLLADSLSLVVPSGASVPLGQAKALVPGASIGVDLSTRLTVGFAAGASVRLAPEISYVSEGSKSYATNSQIGDYVIDGSDTELWLGLGIYYVAPLAVRPLGSPCLFYLGPRAGLAFVSAEAKVENAMIPTDATLKRTDFWAGVVLGGELLVSSHFSVGAEAQATKVFRGSPDVLGVTINSVGVQESWVDVETRGTAVLRFYP